ncbi:hypothetical protein COK01_24810 [Priestia megaterium]|uniref:hypothetical protein n=1 Tax=Priestia megaterium TaxID=1404 RepID=UPI000BF4EB52|nr:hypothetical protein [Priestia megaterium]PFP45272.1 hypothetical protein COK01_24810 [Priestia megaterium]
MELRFENWIKKQDISEDALILFDESIKCYRVGAYRASFLMSYLGFMKALRDRLLKSGKPTQIHEAEWEKTRNDLRDDKIWEEIVFTTTQEKQKIDKRTSVSKVFLISNDIIEDMPYWRRKRNECAHAKDTVISYSHVDTFWLFLESNLSKFVVNGGKDALLEKFGKYIDTRFTRPGEDFRPLIEEIISVVKQEDVPEFLQEINANYIHIDDMKTQFGYKFWHEIAYSSNSNLQNAFIKFITGDADTFANFIAAFPDRLALCTSEEQLVRFFWNESLFNRVHSVAENFWEIATILLRSNIIPLKEVPRFVSKLADQISSFSKPNEIEAKELEKHGLFSVLRSSLFESDILISRNSYNNANTNDSKLMVYLENQPLDSLIVKQLNTLFESYNFGSFHHKLQRFIRNNPQFIEAFNQIAKKDDLTVVDFFNQEKIESVES